LKAGPEIQGSDDMSKLNVFLLGVLTMASLTAGLFFLRFYRRIHDRLFLIFAAAFFLLGVNWLLIPVLSQDETSSALLYTIRLVAFVLILAAIVDKNRSHPKA
jgi:hypothetical protein